ncbi:MAG: carbohydrate ABC transporter permease [Roseiflexaceae bacterium]|nr:carbohydrate ABC transporter permease [Roseiflexaceae bacterium]
MAVTVNNPQQAVSTRDADRPPARHYVGITLRYILLTLMSLLFFSPFLLSFFGTFKTGVEILAYPPEIFPRTWNPNNWVRVFQFTVPPMTGPSIPWWTFNSLWLAVVNVITQMFFCSLAAYAFARIRFPGREAIFAIMIATMTIPGVVTLIPGYVFFAKIGWINTYWPLIIPKLVVPFGIFMLAQFFRSIPKDLEEAAFMDGLGRFGTFWNIAVPLSRPALITLAILQFQASWNEFTGPFLYLQDVGLKTLTAGMAFFRQQFIVDFSAMLVGAMLNAIPVLVLFFIFNKYYTESSSYAGLAGQ